MTAPTVESAASPQAAQTTDVVAGIPEGSAPIRLPVMVVEGMWTADGRYLEPGSLQTRTLPIALYSQTKSSHGSLDGDTATVLAGAITEVTRRPGPEVTQLSTGQPFPDGTYVWEGSGWMYTDVPAPPDKPVYTLVKDGALRGNSVDLSDVDAEFEFEDGADPNVDMPKIRITSGFIGATTLVGQPAFPDAYIELDGHAMDMAETLTAGGVPMWRAQEVGDVCAPCTAIDGPRDHVIVAAISAATSTTDGYHVDSLAILDGEDIRPDEITPRHTGGMIALVPSNPNMLRVPNGDPAEDLHLTLAYLGDDVTDWQPEDRAAVLRIAMEATDFEAMSVRLAMEAEERGDADPGQAVRDAQEYGRMPAQKGPLEGAIFSHAVFNPNGDNGHDPATVYLLDGSADREAINALADSIRYQIRDAIGTTQFPEQHHPFVPHVTAGYNLPVEMLTYTGPVQFDRLRVALGDEVIDYPLGGGGPLLASIWTGKTPPVEIFEDPMLTGPTPVTVGEMTEWGAQVYGHLACWGTCHIGFQGKCVTPPRSASDYAYFLVHSTQASTPDGRVLDIPVGYGTVGTGHADVKLGAMAAAEHYDHTGTIAFEYTMGEDEYGIWFAGRMLPGLSVEMEHKARGAVFSGDWRTIRGKLELVASLAVNVPGFPVPRVRVASGQPVALTAAGIPGQRSLDITPDVDSFQESLAAAGLVKPSDMREILGYVRKQAVDSTLAELAALTSDVDDELGRAAQDYMTEIAALTEERTEQ